MAADRQTLLTNLKRHVPIGVKRRVRRTIPERYHRLWDPDWHRSTVRGNTAFWDYLGKLQLDYLVEQGLQPEHYLLDVGCGPLRAGVHFIGYLEPGHYAGVDKRGARLERAAEVELPRHGLEDKAPLLLVNEDFEFSKLGQTFDYAIAQSVFTHLPANNIVRCLVEMDGAPAEVDYLIRRMEEEIARNRDVIDAASLAEFQRALEIYRGLREKAR